MSNDSDIPLVKQLLSPQLQLVALPVLSYALMLFFLVQGPVLFGKSWERWEFITLIYTMFSLPALIFALTQREAFTQPAWKVLGIAGITALGGFFLFSFAFRGFKYESGFPLGGMIATVVYQIFVITLSEEQFFRGFLLEIGKGRVGIGVLASAGMFSLFHLAAYSTAGGLNFAAFGVAFVMGLALGFVYIATRRFAGIGANWGIHIGWNLALLFA